MKRTITFYELTGTFIISYKAEGDKTPSGHVIYPKYKKSAATLS